MNENESIFYSPEEIRKIQERGVQIPDVRSVPVSYTHLRAHET